MVAGIIDFAVGFKIAVRDVTEPLDAAAAPGAVRRRRGVPRRARRVPGAPARRAQRRQARGCRRCARGLRGGRGLPAWAVAAAVTAVLAVLCVVETAADRRVRYAASE